MSIVERFDADCEECWEMYTRGHTSIDRGEWYTSIDRDELVKHMEEDGWLVIGDECWCPDCRHLVEGK